MTQVKGGDVQPERARKNEEFQGASGSRVARARLMALAGVASSLMLAAVLFVSAFAQAVFQSVEALRGVGHEEALKKLVVASVRHADVLLIATAMLIIGIGLYSIFIRRVEPLPQWLTIRGFEDLKNKLASVVVVALIVDFFTVALEWSGSGDILPFGAAIGAVLLGLSAYVLAHRTKHHRTEPVAPPGDRDVSAS